MGNPYASIWYRVVGNYWSIIVRSECISEWEYSSHINVKRCRVIDGWETLDDIEKIPVHEKNYRPLTEIRLRRATIHANPLANWTFTILNTCTLFQCTCEAMCNIDIVFRLYSSLTTQHIIILRWSIRKKCDFSTRSGIITLQFWVKQSPDCHVLCDW